MAYQKLQGRRAINVYPQDGVIVPSPSDKITSGSNTSVVANELVDSGADFTSKNVKAGFTVYKADYRDDVNFIGGYHIERQRSSPWF